MAQGIVTRLETNCFTLKAMAMTFAVALLAFLGSIKSPNWVYPLAGCLPVCVFWIMDAQYLRLGRAFRKLFDEIRLHKIEEPFSMKIDPYLKKQQKVIRIAISWSILWYCINSFNFPFRLALFFTIQQGGHKWIENAFTVFLIILIGLKSAAKAFIRPRKCIAYYFRRLAGIREDQ